MDTMTELHKESHEKGDDSFKVGHNEISIALINEIHKLTTILRQSELELEQLKVKAKDSRDRIEALRQGLWELETVRSVK